jgi:hypothetical protein
MMEWRNVVLKRNYLISKLNFDELVRTLKPSFLVILAKARIQ